jgi:ubiquitin-protein ligase
MDDAKIPYDMSRLPDVWWRLYGEQLVEGSDVLMEVVEAIRTDMDDIRVQSIFTLPRWLKNEFTDSEIEFFVHHFKSIDLDGGGSIDAFEFQQLTVSLGCPVSLEESQQILDDFDDDGSGTIDFIEFMTLMFRVQHGTLDLESNRLAQTIMESKAQLRILQEISEIKKNPPVLGLLVDKYGGSPVVCDYLLRGPPNTPYAGGSFRLRVKYRTGYPFSCPDVNFVTRIMCINVMPKVNGENHLVHLSHLWDCNWNTEKLLIHVDELLKRHDYSLIPSELYQLACSYGEEIKSKDTPENASNDLAIAEGKNETADKKKAKTLPVEEVLKSLPRVEQVLVTNTIIHMFDPKRFDSLARSYTRRFSENFDEREAASGGGEVAPEAESYGPSLGEGAGEFPMEAPQQSWEGDAVDWDEEVQYGNYDNPNNPNAAPGQQQQQYYYDEATGQYYTYDESQYYSSEGNTENYVDTPAP